MTRSTKTWRTSLSLDNECTKIATEDDRGRSKTFIFLKYDILRELQRLNNEALNDLYDDMIESNEIILDD